MVCMIKVNIAEKSLNVTLLMIKECFIESW
jgi:hypothetical protein